MKFKIKVTPFLIAIGGVSLAGCVPPEGGRYNNAVYDAPTYDSTVYSPKYTPEFYDSSYYHSDNFESRAY